jgi:hypothetical protein
MGGRSLEALKKRCIQIKKAGIIYEPYHELCNPTLSLTVGECIAVGPSFGEWFDKPISESEPSTGDQYDVSERQQGRTHWSRAARSDLDVLSNLVGLLGLCVIAPELLEVLKIPVVDTAGDVLSGENGAIELLNGRVELVAALNQIGQGLEDDEIGTNVLCDLFGRTAVRNEFRRRRHVDAVHVRVSDRGSA